MPQVRRAGDVELVGGFKVPVYSVSMVSGAQDGLETFAPQTTKLNIRVAAEIANKLDAYAYPMGIMLVPKKWVVRSARYGADASVYMLFSPDTSGQSYLSFSSAGACAGCAISDGSLYFEEAKKQAKSNEFFFYRASKIVRTETLNRFLKRYRIKGAHGNPVSGMAYFDEDDDLPFSDVQISAPVDQQSMVSAILNQFNVPK
jgi:hypothetical protein